MSLDWIKMRTDLYRDPKVILMAEALLSSDGDLARYVNQNLQRDMTVTRNVTRNAVVGALVAVWGVMRHQGKQQESDLFIADITVSVLDDISDLPGFGEAMEAAGWVVQTDEGLVFPRFYEGNNTAPDRDSSSKNAERQRRFRESKRNVTRNVTSNTKSNAREEKRREENIEIETQAAAAAAAVATVPPKAPQNRFVKPTQAEVAEFVTALRGPPIDATEFWLHYESNGWKVGQNPMKCWQSAVRQWSARQSKSQGNQYANRPGASSNGIRTHNAAAAREQSNADAFAVLEAAAAASRGEESA